MEADRPWWRGDVRNGRRRDKLVEFVHDPLYVDIPHYAAPLADTRMRPESNSGNRLSRNFESCSFSLTSCEIFTRIGSATFANRLNAFKSGQRRSAPTMTRAFIFF